MIEESRWRRPGRRRAALAAAALILCVGIAAAAAVVLAPRGGPGTGGRPGAAHRSAPAPAGEGSPMAQATPAIRQPSGFAAEGPPAPGTNPGGGGPAPTAITIPAIGVAASLGRVGVDQDGTITVPSDFDQPAWYDGGPVPGAVGPAVIVGHLDSFTGPAVFARLSRLRAGDVVDIARADGSTVEFHVQRVATFSQDAFPTGAVYGAVSDPALRLITCGGTYDVAKRRYSDNVVVFASA